MLETPTKFTLVAAGAEANSRLNAFDNALLASGIGNLNLVRVSSILPPGATRVDTLDIPAGSLVPTAYGTITSDTPGDLVSAAVGVGRQADGYGVIMEFSGKCSQAEAEATVAQMVRDAFAQRNLVLAELLVKGVEHRVEKVGCAFAAVALWY